MEQGIWTVSGHCFCSNLKFPNNVANLFSTSLQEFGFSRTFCTFCLSMLGLYSLWENGFSKEINLCSTKMAFLHCQPKACLLDAFESCSQVGDEVMSIIRCNADVVHILGTLIRFKNSVEVFSHEAGKCGQCSANALCQTSVSKCAASEIEGQHFN